ncbi:hypothetical protein AB5I39_02455 [Sphingomonas sp. MMS24-J45]|uniref:hypothetical protein n=1 Tax=Sphingomonas sp. MMS24-J45 TaxID=3238806 RepID=UPI00384C26E6
MWLAALLALGAPDPACGPGETLAFVCGAEHPEDVVAIPDTRWIIASGFAPGAGLKLVDGAAKVATPAYDGRADQVDPDHRTYPDCPGPVDPALFNARGLSLRKVAAGRYTLHVVNHGGRELIEVFDVHLAAGRPELRWRGCRLMPAGQVGNAVATFADGTVLVTVLTSPGTTITDFVRGERTGAVWRWAPGATGFTELPGTRLPGNNGLESDPDQRHFYVVAFGWHAVSVYDRRHPVAPVRTIVMPGFMPDNIHWSAGRLIAAGMRLDEPACGGLRRIVSGAADKMLCHRGYAVGAVDPVAGKVTILAAGEPEPGFNGVSAAAIVGDTLWLGSYQANRLAWRSLPAR